jgi:GrpB-like predicted nucleotidyltransferase (UPF0157 family)
MILEKYSAIWIHHFNAIRSELQQALTGCACAIEHVGSTAVPQLDAKPIIDIDIIFEVPQDFESIQWALEKVGYRHHGNQGIADRDVFKKNGELCNNVLDSIKHHLYICPVHSKALERHILSRNFMRKNEWARIKYQDMKYDLAEQAHQDSKRYAALKELHVNELIDFMIKEENASAQQSNKPG